MINIYLYGTLVLLCFVMLGITYLKSRSRLLGVMYFGSIGLALFFDYLIYVWGKAYIYTPHILDNKYDSHIGAIVSDTFSVPATITMVTVLNLKWQWWLILGLAYAVVEESFIKLGLYQHFWWKTLYTFTALMVAFWLIRNWYHSLNRAHGRLITFLTLVAILYGIRTQLSLIAYAVLQSRQLSVQWIEALGRDSSAINTFITLPAVAVLAFLLVYNYSYFWKAAWVVFFFIVDLILRRIGVVQTLTPWDNFYIIAADIVVLLLGGYFFNILKQNTIRRTFKI